MTDETREFNLRYVGARFEGGRLPVEVLLDLPAFRDLVVAFAKTSWKQKHPGRERVPKGFDKSLTFDLLDIADGSAIPKLEWRGTEQQQNLPGFDGDLKDVLDDGYRRFVALVADAEKENVGKALSSEQIYALNRLGSGLKNAERIEFVGANDPDGNVIYLDFARRRKLITDARETYQVRFEGLGTLIKNDANGSVTIRTFEYGDMTIELDRQAVKEEFDGNLEFDVQFDLQIELDHNDGLKDVIEVYDLTVIDEKVSEALAVCRNRLDEMLAKGADIAGGEVPPVTEGAVSSAHNFLKRRPTLSNSYKFFPGEAGTIFLEFETETWDLSIIFSSSGGVEIYGIALGDQDDFDSIEFDEISDEFLAEFDQRVAN
ncbi:hypothetical protein [uncultured Erythrobacter sp.]|uniref:hypothetical protein n=1 Tax=uncultured Erythrobacter sp. TaxID=263913 RepID=UPI002605B7B4|nr:hypothetical protein [uncultured Erythrobacter sp.]